MEKAKNKAIEVSLGSHQHEAAVLTLVEYGAGAKVLSGLQAASAAGNLEGVVGAYEAAANLVYVSVSRAGYAGAPIGEIASPAEIIDAMTVIMGASSRRELDQVN